ncbi:hypothetical protein CND00095 [Cryptococcus deneoformans JEC21]|uniref:Uncharacterized protein n=1 Tax=Cryptococcus deneoformans (strain JEC21 / ATCC MYA-565) TaxID=214684 RepID=A0A0S2LIH3_CRYD1|nr:hypothetical protein CND00095 [Cryptococcus neoformans var. neoformans JEC21]ALO60514.1 hypothetical protein CND00095 [Cryptococcus neoformans var. neoformans JEC21]
MPSRNDIKPSISDPVSVTSTTGFGLGFTPSNTSTDNSITGSSIRGQKISHPFNVASSTGFVLTSNNTANPPPVASQGLPFSRSAQSDVNSAISDTSREVVFHLYNPTTPPPHQTDNKCGHTQASAWSSPSSSYGAGSPPDQSAWSPDSSVQGGNSIRLPPSQSSNTIDSVVLGSAVPSLSGSVSGLSTETFQTAPERMERSQQL